ncbi:hypothetical protein ASPTUDRAFT_810711 [Aspergillus tubingensis CBS 134.48]|uniref:Uncharacterized protein n=1 Tax=Aspergillus tubingensis (strain CBS 134.48) TaxID=767770 RepID=A0A1L9MW33_ASPTC|nr:hypothetical protein ASPTUDRAFT_810711 [Aspergillus tubingensis CBS 134.48]
MIYRGAACQLVVWLGYRVSSSSSGIISASLLSGTGTIFRCRHVDPLFCVCSCILVCLHHFFQLWGGLLRWVLILPIWQVKHVVRGIYAAANASYLNLKPKLSNAKIAGLAENR